MDPGNLRPDQKLKIRVDNKNRYAKTFEFTTHGNSEYVAHV